ncbi:MAG TPA: hypothetical protein VIL32_03730 [Steroidobacteraceae bacterium]
MSESDSSIASVPVSRRRLLGTGGTMIALAALGAGSTGAAVSAVVAAATKKAYYTGAIHFLLNGVDQGVLSAAKGGSLQIHASNAITVESVVLTCNGNLQKSFFDWVNACLQGQPGSPQNAEIAFVNAAGAVENSLLLTGARATSVAIEKIDIAQSKEPIDISVTVAAASASQRFSRGGALPVSNIRPRPLLQQNAVLFIHGLEEVTRQARRIGELRMTSSSQGLRGRQEVNPYEPLTFEVSLSSARPLYAWFESWAKGSIQPRQGVLQFLDTARRNVLASVDLIQLSPLRIGSFPSDADDQVATIEVALQPRSLSLNFTKIE